jgi:outer membrane lipoprotein-sorting protein
MSVFRSALPAAVLAVAFAVIVQAQSVDEIVDKNIRAKGGADKLKSVQSMKLSGRLSGRGIDAPFTIWSKRPNMARQETEVQGTPMVRAFDGTTAWMMVGTSPQEVGGPEAQATRQQAEFDSPLLDYKAKGHRIDLVGIESVGGTKVYHLKLTTKTGQIQHYYLDADTGLDRQTSVTIEQAGHPVTVTSSLSDYRDVDGIKVPFTVRQSVNGEPVSTLNIEKVEFNAVVDDAIFKMPRKQQ